MVAKERLQEKAEELAEYLGENIQKVLQRILQGRDLLAQEWKEADPQTEEEVIQFYKTCHSYLYDLSYAHSVMTPLSRYEAIRTICKCRGISWLVDYGGGVGEHCIKLADIVENIWYVDLQSKVLEYAEWRFKTRHLSIPIIACTDAMPPLREGFFDAVICTEVLEHVFDPVKTLGVLCSWLAIGGVLFLQTSFERSDLYPMHMHEGLQLDFSRFGLLGTEGRLEVWEKKR